MLGMDKQEGSEAATCRVFLQQAHKLRVHGRHSATAPQRRGAWTPSDALVQRASMRHKDPRRVDARYHMDGVSLCRAVAAHVDVRDGPAAWQVSQPFEKPLPTSKNSYD